METNMNPEIHAELRDKGKALLAAAYEFWRAHQRLCGPRAIVWIEDDSGHFVLFTRGEYRQQIQNNCGPFTEEIPLDEPFKARE